MSRCQYCDQQIPAVKEQGRDCDTCGGKHRLMEVCPEKPGMIGLLHEWIEGSREPMHFVAVTGVAVLFVMATLVLVMLLGG